MLPVTQRSSLGLYHTGSLLWACPGGRLHPLLCGQSSESPNTLPKITQLGYNQLSYSGDCPWEAGPIPSRVSEPTDNQKG